MSAGAAGTPIPRRGRGAGLASLTAAVLLASACSGGAPAQLPGEVPAASLPAELAAMLGEVPSPEEIARSVEWGRSVDRRMAQQARDAGQVGQALGVDAGAILEDADASREALLDRAAEERTAQALAMAQTPPVAIAESFGSFMTLLSPDGLAQQFLDWRRNFGDEMPPDETGFEQGDNRASVKIHRTRVVSHGVMTVQAELVLTVSLADPPGGTLAETFMGLIELPVCPDESGEVAATLDWTNSSEAATSLGSRGGEFNLDTAATGSVGDDAHLASIDMKISASSRATASAPGNQAEGAYGEITANVTVVPSRGAEGITAYEGRVVHQSSRATDDAIASLRNLALVVSYSLMTDAYREAEKLWRDGVCVAVRVTDPEGGSKSKVEPESTHSIAAEVTHLIEGGILDVPITAQMKSGETSVDPSGEPIESPATFTYVAPPERDMTGRVLLRTVSRRGIGEAEVTFTTGGGHRLRLTGVYDVTLQLGPGAHSSGEGIDILEGDLEAETFEGVFEASSEGTATQRIGDLTCFQEWSGTQRLRVSGTPNVEAGQRELLLIFTPAGPPEYAYARSEGGEFCTFEERLSASGDPILPFNDSYIIDQISLPIPGPPSEGEPTVYHLPVIGQIEGAVVNADWKVEWLESRP